MENLKITLGTVLLPALSDLLGTITPIIEAFSRRVASNPGLTLAIIKAVGAFAALRLATVALRLAGLMSMGAYLRTVALGMSTIGATAVRLGNAARESMRLNTALATMQGVKASKLSGIGAALRGVVFAVAGISLATLGTIAGGILAMAGAGYLFWKHWDRIEAIADGVGRALQETLAPAMERLKPIMEPLAPFFENLARGFKRLDTAVDTAFGWIGGMFDDIGNREMLTADQETAIADRAYRMARSAIDAFAGFPETWMQMGRDAGESLRNGLQEKFADLIEWVKGIPARIKAAIGNIDLSNLIKMPRLFGGGEEVQERARGGAYGIGPRLVGERGPELEYQSRAGFIAHNRALQQMASLSARAVAPMAVPQARSLQMAPAAARGAPANITNNFTISIDGGANASVDDLRRAFGREVTSAMRTHFSDAF